MTTIVIVAAGAVSVTALVCALMLCVAAARADRLLRSAALDALGWRPPDDWPLVKRERRPLPYKQSAAS